MHVFFFTKLLWHFLLFCVIFHCVSLNGKLFAAYFGHNLWIIYVNWIRVNKRRMNINGTSKPKDEKYECDSFTWVKAIDMRRHEQRHRAKKKASTRSIHAWIDVYFIGFFFFCAFLPTQMSMHETFFVPMKRKQINLQMMLIHLFHRFHFFVFFLFFDFIFLLFLRRNFFSSRVWCYAFFFRFFCSFLFNYRQRHRHSLPSAVIHVRPAYFSFRYYSQSRK